MTTVSDNITAAIVAALGTITPAVASIKVEPAGDPPAGRSLEVYEGDDQIVEREAVLTRKQRTITISGFVDGPGGAAPTADRNALIAAVVAAVMADDTLAGVVEMIEESDCRRHTAVLASARRLAFDQDFDVQFVTSRLNPAQAPH